MVVEDLLVDLARRVYIENMGAVIARAWRKSHRRLATKSRKVIAVQLESKGTAVVEAAVAAAATA